MTQEELPIIQKTYDLIRWYVPHLNKMPRDFRFCFADRIQNTLYTLLEELIRARYARRKTEILERLNAELDVLRHQTRLCVDFNLMDHRRYEHAAGLINQIGENLGGWIRHQQSREAAP